MKTYWHFARIKDGVPIMRDCTPIEIGQEYTTDRAELCEVGYHGSGRIIDALRYAPGPWISKRVITGDIERGDDKVCGTRCVHSVGFDATEVLRKFARLCALDVIHLWSAPEVVVRYLRTGDETIRAAALVAAQDATEVAAWAAALVAAQDAAQDAALVSAQDAAWSAVLNAAQDAVWASARDVAWEAVLNAAQATTEVAAWAAENAAQDAAWEAEIKKQNKRLTRMVNRRLKALEGDE